ncbi:hypothetical protein [Endozoicomonas sp. ALC020]|uniref:hypothetical protein n=1 Tax=unclassified Endozoicomonas TaxID=2644528 RepID=UPI003BAF0CCC
MYDQFLDRDKVIRFFRNTDLSVNGHVTDAEQWLSQSYELYGLEQLKESEETLFLLKQLLLTGRRHHWLYQIM